MLVDDRRRSTRAVVAVWRNPNAWAAARGAVEEGESAPDERPLVGES
jgi:hypothetical protein